MVIDIKAIGEDNPSISDKEVLEIAVKEKRVILTFDKDYGELIFHYGLKPTSGVIFLRLDKYGPDKPGEIIHKLLGDKVLKTEMKITVFDGKTIRQRKFDK